MSTTVTKMERQESYLPFSNSYCNYDLHYHEECNIIMQDKKEEELTVLPSFWGLLSAVAGLNWSSQQTPARIGKFYIETWLLETALNLNLCSYLVSRMTKLRMHVCIKQGTITYSHTLVNTKGMRFNKPDQNKKKSYCISSSCI